MGCGDIWLRARSLPWSMPSWNLRFVNGNASGNRSLTLAPATALMAPNVLSVLFTMSGLVVVHASQKEQRQVQAFLHTADRRSPTKIEHTRASATKRTEIARAPLIDTQTLVSKVLLTRVTRVAGCCLRVSVHDSLSLLRLCVSFLRKCASAFNNLWLLLCKCTLLRAQAVLRAALTDIIPPRWRAPIQNRFAPPIKDSS